MLNCSSGTPEGPEVQVCHTAQRGRPRGVHPSTQRKSRGICSFHSRGIPFFCCWRVVSLMVFVTYFLFRLHEVYKVFGFEAVSPELLIITA